MAVGVGCLCKQQLLTSFYCRRRNAQCLIGGKILSWRGARQHSAEGNGSSLGRLGIDHAVTHVQHLVLLQLQGVQRIQNALGIGLFGLDAVAADDQIKQITRVVFIKDGLDAVGVFGGDDTDGQPALLDGAQHVQDTIVQNGIGGHDIVSTQHKQPHELLRTLGVLVAGQHGVGMRQRQPDGATDGVALGLGVAHLGQGVVGGENNAFLGIAQGVIEIKQDGFEHGQTPYFFFRRSTQRVQDADGRRAA